MNCFRDWLLCMFLCSCTTPGAYYPPFEVGGFGVDLHFGGYTVPAKVVASPVVSTPTVLVPANSQITSPTIPVTNSSSGQTSQLPVQLSTKVDKPVVAIPQ